MTNYIDRLVAELCPDGVEYRPLGEIADIGTGKSDKKDAQESGQYPFYVRSKTILRSSKYLYDETAIVIPGEGGVGEIFHFVSGKYDLHQRAYRVSFTVDEMNPKFGYYYISSFFKEYINRHAVEATVKSIRKPMLVKFEVPVPPLEIQEAIVEILDKFTNLEAELEAELEARTLQYEYYRGSLFGTLKDPATGLPAIAGLVKTLCPDGVEYRSLKDVVAKNYGGGTPSKSKAEYWEGNIPWASVGDLSDDVLEVTDTRSKITEEGVKGSSTNIVPAGAVIVAIKINPGRMKIAGMNLAINQDIRGLVLNDSMNARFLTYYFRTLMFAGHGTIVKSITNKHLMETKIPVPPMEIQQRIVDILDRFDALTSSLSEGLPAELAARRSQYEYYRDQLLTFPRKGGN
ncbi:restriction endonuclease subunit S [Rothia sp. HMSC066G02]|uniref:restriction endonuclease subunit S n=1 Tax=Rothia sp. HMSC066G02 TaxID=1739398 RepID=UPI0008A5A4B5|nr:restriction endonuclease subunit S [Rothia sp. HMSC066G02]